MDGCAELKILNKYNAVVIRLNPHQVAGVLRNAQELLHKACHSIHSIPFPNGGICNNIEYMTSLREYRGVSFVTIVGHLSRGWKYHSGDYTFPVGGPDKYHNDRRNGTLWQGEGLVMRIDLLEHIIAKLEKWMRS